MCIGGSRVMMRTNYDHKNRSNNLFQGVGAWNSCTEPRVSGTALRPFRFEECDAFVDSRPRLTYCFPSACACSTTWANKQVRSAGSVVFAGAAIEHIKGVLLRAIFRNREGCQIALCRTGVEDDHRCCIVYIRQALVYELHCAVEAARAYEVFDQLLCLCQSLRWIRTGATGAPEHVAVLRG